MSRSFEDQRAAMVEHQLARRGVRDHRVLEAMGRTPRERFLPERLAEVAYEDRPLPIDEGQTISQPYIVALMIEAARLRRDDRVLEIGAGSGYAAAVMSEVAAEVYAIERRHALAVAARRRLDRLGYSNVHLREGDGTLGWPDAAPFDAILTAACGPAAPEALKGQLKTGGRLVIPLGEVGEVQSLVRITRVGDEAFEEEALTDVQFVPLIGAQGWPDVP